MPSSGDYTKKIGDLLNSDLPSLDSYGTPANQQSVPEWLQKQGEFGLGQQTESAMFRLRNRGNAQNYGQTLQGLTKNEGITGLGGGFSDQAGQQAFDDYSISKAQTQFQIGRESDQVKGQAKQQMLGIDQFNRNLTFQYQSTLSDRQMQMKNMKLSNLISARDIEAQREIQEDQAWIDFAGNVLGAAGSFFGL